MPNYESNDQLAIKFLKKFGELEYLVKRQGYRLLGRNNVVIGTDFNDWIEQTNPKIDSEVAQKIIKLAPKVLVVGTDGLVFVDKKVRGDINKKAMESVKRVRNNLYHGEKQGFLQGGEESSVTRAEALVKASIDVLDEFLLHCRTDKGCP